MADLVQITRDYDEYEIAFDPRHAYMALEVGSRTAKIRRDEGKLRIMLTEEALRSLEQALWISVRSSRGNTAGDRSAP
jgi:hypothetical protein